MTYQDNEWLSKVFSSVGQTSISLYQAPKDSSNVNKSILEHGPQTWNTIIHYSLERDQVSTLATQTSWVMNNSDNPLTTRIPQGPTHWLTDRLRSVPFHWRPWNLQPLQRLPPPHQMRWPRLFLRQCPWAQHPHYLQRPAKWVGPFLRLRLAELCSSISIAPYICNLHR